MCWGAGVRRHCLGQVRFDAETERAEVSGRCLGPADAVRRGAGQGKVEPNKRREKRSRARGQECRGTRRCPEVPRGTPGRVPGYCLSPLPRPSPSPSPHASRSLHSFPWRCIRCRMHPGCRWDARGCTGCTITVHPRDGCPGHSANARIRRPQRMQPWMDRRAFYKHLSSITNSISTCALFLQSPYACSKFDRESTLSVRKVCNPAAAPQNRGTCTAL